MQTAIGLLCVGLGMLHFVDRDRDIHTVRSYYLGSPQTATGRGVLAVTEVLVGFALLFTA